MAHNLLEISAFLQYMTFLSLNETMILLKRNKTK